MFAKQIHQRHKSYQAEFNRQNMQIMASKVITILKQRYAIYKAFFSPNLLIQKIQKNDFSQKYFDVSAIKDIIQKNITFDITPLWNTSLFLSLNTGAFFFKNT
jgi:hypothetical protein